jgi:hypothetical protein
MLPHSTNLPPAVAALAADLATARGTVAVALGGSRATRDADADSDWDLGWYYRGDVGLDAIARYGVVHPPGSWGRLMNGGAWLRIDGLKVDVLMRDLDAVERWTERAKRGEFEIDALLGYTAGVPTYLLCAELASCTVLHGVLSPVAFPDALRANAPPRWRFCRSFSLEYARAHARRGDVVGAVGQAAKAVVEEAHARHCESGRWVCNEKRILARAGLDRLDDLFAATPRDARALVAWVNAVADALGSDRESMLA